MFDGHGRFLREVELQGLGGSKGPGTHCLVNAIAFDRAGQLYVCNAGVARQCIEVFKQDGTFITYFGETGWSDGQFIQPAGLLIESDGRMTVCDKAHGLQVFAFSA